ncbi:hypothetical protein [Conexibacter sp. DBS9H8]|uniref:hypothetical protein n=1 Tax=Conexibacter sp. DBS9H8 TaxID=2937801 RepID=UPI00200CFD5A|nr:hypothetical protein [Conexibacter sp. DBS9H8]
MSLITRPAVLAACAALAAGGGTAAVLVTSAGAATVSTATTAPGTGHGTGTVTFTGPGGKSHTRTGAVSCRVANGHYMLTSVRKLAHGRRILRVIVPGYTGAGSYHGTVVMMRRHANAFRGRDLRHVPVTLTTTGGSFSYSKTLNGTHHHALKGKTVSARASWTCSA